MTRQLPHAEAFARFHRENPHVYQALERLAFRLRVRGIRRWGIKALWEVLRYEAAISTTAPVADFKLNNNYTAHYARLLMANNPEDLGGFFEVRERQPDEGG